MNHQAHPIAPTTAPHPAGGWIRPLPAGSRHDDRPDDHSLVRLAGLIFIALAVLTLATGAALIGLASYGLITWRRTRWWPPVLLGLAAAAVAIAALGGPGPVLHQHLTVLRQLTTPESRALGRLVEDAGPSGSSPSSPSAHHSV